MSTYTIQGGDTLYSIASKLNTTVAILEEANQGIDPSKLQVGQVIQLTVNHGTSYTIKAGDTLYSIAQSQNSTVEAIEKANPGLVPTDLKIGAQITISSTGSAPPAPSPTPPPSQNSTPQPASSSLYTIQEGDTFEIIGAKFGVSDRAIEAANPGAVRTNLQIGAQLVIPGNSAPPQPAPTPTPAPTPSPPMANAYPIQGGDTYEIIAAKFGTTAAAIAAANPTLVPTNLQIGAQISIPGQNEQTPAPAPAPVPQPTPLEATNTYTIQSGDTFSNIATKLNTTADAIQAANPSVNPTTLQVGQIINVPQGGSGPVQPQPTTGIPGGTEIGGGYVNYSGPASNFPDPSRWAPYSVLWEQNKTLLSYNDSPHQIDLIASSIQTVSASSGIDPRAILCTIMQESGGNVHVGNTFNGIVNTGIMQAFNGVNFDPNNEEGSILQMIRDGSEGSSNGPGLKQAMAQYGNYYVAFRTYNSGSPNLADLNDARGATGDYVQKMANRLMGHVWNGM